MSGKLTLTKHNGRSGQNGVYNPKHNDRSFDISGSEHIDPERMKQNIYWDWIRGYSDWEDHNPNEDVLDLRFESVEKHFYYHQYDDYCEAQHERNRKSGHTKRNRSPDDLRLSKKTCPEESLIQIGSMEYHVEPEVLLAIAKEYFAQYEARFGEHIHILDWGLHCDESTPHIHERHVFDCENEYGEIAPQQEKALEVLDIPLPYPDQPNSKTNNRKVMFDSICRTMLIDIAKAHGLEMQEEPQYGGRAYLEKQDYILMKQKEKLADQEQKLRETKQDLDRKAYDLFQAEYELRDKNVEIIQASSALKEKEQELEELTIMISDVESMIDEVAEAAYDKAVEVVTDAVVEETHNADFSVIMNFRNHDLEADRSLTDKGKLVVRRVLDHLMEKFRGMTNAITARLDNIMRDPSTKEKHMEPIKEVARKSVLADLHRKQTIVESRKVSKSQHRLNREADLGL